MSRTVTANDPTIGMAVPDGSLTLTHPRPARPGVVVAALHPGGHAGVPPHWHETHTEHLRVVQGYALIRCGTLTKLYGPDEVVTVPPYVIHGFARGDAPQARQYWREEMTKGWEAEDVVIEEWTSPMDGQKEVFFRNGFSMYKDMFEGLVTGKTRFRVGMLPAIVVQILQLMNFSRRTDNYMVMLPLALGIGGDGKATLLARCTTYVMFGIATLLARMFGWRFWQEEYTPVELRPVCRGMEKS